jgi:hypothetical protein
MWDRELDVIGDIEPDDVVDVAPADDQAVARLFVAAVILARLGGAMRAEVGFDRLPPPGRALFTFWAATMRGVWRVLGDETLARVVLDVLRALSGDPDRPTFDRLARRDRRALVDVVAALRARLVREGSV